MTSPLNYNWQQVKPGVWQRPIDEIEQFYSTLAVLYEGSGRMFFGITGHISLSIKSPKDVSSADAGRHVDEALRKAWLALRYDHPTLASQATQNSETGQWVKTYNHIEGEDDKNSWLDKTLVHIFNGQSGNEWANSDPPAPKLPTLFILHLPTEESDGSRIVRRDLVLRSPHDILDGIGTLMLLNNYIALAAEAYEKGDTYNPPLLDGSEASNLSPSYRIAANIPDKLPQAQLDRLDAMAAQKAAVASDPSIQVLALPFRKGSLVPGRHQRVALTFTENETQQLLAVCKKVKATPTHAFHAAAAIVVRDLQDKPVESKKVRYINYILRNERPNCSEPYSSMEHPAAVYHSVSGQSLVVDMDLHPENHQPNVQEFHKVLETIKDFYLTVKQDKDFYILAPTMFAQGTPDLPPSPRPLPIPPPKAHPSVSISSMGCVEAIIAPETKAFSARDPWVTGEELGNGLGLFLGTFRGELCLSAAYNDAWHAEGDVRTYLERCKEVVFLGLGME
ncbi:hypothetical protein FPSE_04008 [Fusarium pseudograminearum CS3096]|uniref:Uncharacterized protein n=1 Tax=Fusarium pseudograminearum (strain CS3096) TaxID=1028729 RepID=K3VPW4_FUSPC|nr:hypothetical protein FPSE_04008 [Fusarium pseudograminearum CS3096]EKJ75828.1 hypothetical protein FPSE_04008 [Fusarium pseudograminearum CS3096]